MFDCLNIGDVLLRFLGYTTTSIMSVVYCCSFFFHAWAVNNSYIPPLTDATKLRSGRGGESLRYHVFQSFTAVCCVWNGGMLGVRPNHNRVRRLAE